LCWLFCKTFFAFENTNSKVMNFLLLEKFWEFWPKFPSVFIIHQFWQAEIHIQKSFGPLQYMSSIWRIIHIALGDLKLAAQTKLQCRLSVEDHKAYVTKSLRRIVPTYGPVRHDRICTNFVGVDMVSVSTKSWCNPQLREIE
jgi:hypothetical protein